MGTVRIRVLDERGYPKNEAMVFMDGDLINLTDDEGYLIVMAPAGAHAFSAIYGRTPTNELRVLVPPDGSVSVNLTLKDDLVKDKKPNDYLIPMIVVPFLLLTAIVLLVLNIMKRMGAGPRRMRDGGEGVKRKKDR